MVKRLDGSSICDRSARCITSAVLGHSPTDNYSSDSLPRKASRPNWRSRRSSSGTVRWSSASVEPSSATMMPPEARSRRHSCRSSCAEARSLWVQDSLGPWLYRVAYRAAHNARSAAKRRRYHEQRAAELRAVWAEPKGEGDDLIMALHEEMGRLRIRYPRARWCSATWRVELMKRQQGSWAAASRDRQESVGARAGVFALPADTPGDWHFDGGHLGSLGEDGAGDGPEFVGEGRDRDRERRVAADENTTVRTNPDGLCHSGEEITTENVPGQVERWRQRLQLQSAPWHSEPVRSSGRSRAPRYDKVLLKPAQSRSMLWMRMASRFKDPASFGIMFINVMMANKLLSRTRTIGPAPTGKLW